MILSMASNDVETGTIDLYWIPLGAEGTGFVRLNGRIYEAIMSRREGRVPLSLCHTALQVQVPEGRYIVETMWPSPDTDTTTRGVVVRGPVWSPILARWRTFRYEVRCWRDGVLPDAAMAVGGPRRVSEDLDRARRLLEDASSVPSLTWGRKPDGASEMWNSNSVISWLLARAGLPMNAIAAPHGHRAPGWETGVRVARVARPSLG